jgi:DNA-binding MarR family transcriptional regulator
MSLNVLSIGQHFIPFMLHRLMFSWANLPRSHLLTVSSLITLYTYEYIVTDIIQEKEFTVESTLEESTTIADTAATTINSEFENKKDTTISSANNSKSKQDLIQNEEQEENSNNIDDINRNSLSTNDFHNNDTKILSFLNQEHGANYSFKGLLRKLNLHQQSLTRALSRLEDLGLIEKSSLGYKLSKNGESIMTLSTTKSNSEKRVGALEEGEEEEVEKKKNGYVQLLQTYVPIDIKSDEIVHALIGKWFNNLRWIGMIESETGEYMLQWMNDNNTFQIILRIISKFLIIETNANSDKEKVEAMIGSYRIFEQITKILRIKLEGLGITAHILNTSNYYKIPEFNN